MEGGLLTLHRIAARLADAGENLAGHPILKRLGLRLVAPHDALVEAALGDYRKLLRFSHLTRPQVRIVVFAAAATGFLAESPKCCRDTAPPQAFDLQEPLASSPIADKSTPLAQIA